MNGFDARLLSIGQAGSFYLNRSRQTDNTDTDRNSSSFDEILADKAARSEDVRFSKHANQRLESRNITLSDEQIERLNSGVCRARNKSINESLVMLDNLAFIVNVRNNTVVTAISGDEESVFTNIDGAVIV